MTEFSLVPMDETERREREPGVVVDGGPGKEHIGLGVGAHEGADRTSKELMTWNPIIRSPDADIGREKKIIDARAVDLVRNTGSMRGAMVTHKDSIVGSQYRLNARPNYRVLGLTEDWATEFQEEVEDRFTLYAESDQCWIDAQRMNTFTGLIRMGIGMFFMTGEVLAASEWLRDRGRPYHTAFQMIDPIRLCNPNEKPDTPFLRRGVERNQFGAPTGYHFRMAHPNDPTAMRDTYKWKYVPARKPWGRPLVLHIIEQLLPDQSRGISDMVSVLKEMRMTKRFHDITLQNAVVNATFAAAIESELPPDLAFESIGAGQGEDHGFLTLAQAMLAQIAEYSGGARNMTIDGVKIPHLYPNTKLKMMPAGTPGGVGTDFETSLLRHIASSLGLSYEQFSKDYSQTNYSSARATMNETWKYMQSRKKTVADRMAQTIYANWLEEALDRGDIKSMPSNAPDFYEGINREAYVRATWLGAGRGQVDELKESKAASERMNSGVSTLERECAALGEDWRDTLRQQAREKTLRAELGLPEPGASSALTAEDTETDEPANNAEKANA